MIKYNKFYENPVDCFDWRTSSANYIVERDEYPKFEIELNGFYKEGSAINPDKLENMQRHIEDRLNGMEEKEENRIDYYRDLICKRMVNTTYGISSYDRTTYPIIVPQIKNIIFNPPATIVFWNDGTKTVVKCQSDDTFNAEKGITMAFFKKMHGNKGHYFEEIKKWTKKYDDEVSEEIKGLLGLIFNSNASDD